MNEFVGQAEPLLENRADIVDRTDRSLAPSLLPGGEEATVTFMANDAVFEQCLAFLESFRMSNPSLRLTMIPFAADIERLSALTGIYDFTISPVDTGRWDALAERLYPGAQQKHKNRLRKLSIFDMPYDFNMYIDIDVVVLKDMRFIFDALYKDDDVNFICTAINNDPWVYNPHYQSDARLAKSKRFSDGFFAFKGAKLRGLAYSTLIENLDFYLSVRASDVFSQPATNFIVDMAGIEVREVYRLFPEVSPQVWYAGRIEDVGGEILAEDGRDVLFVHWAGPVNFDGDYKMKPLFERFREAAHARLDGPASPRERQAI